MNENLKPVKELTPFTKMIMSIGTLPSSFYASMSYYESMVWLYEYLKNQIIPTINNNGEAVEELQALYIQLKEYVDNYFENLDVQEEINNKLDEMAESGVLADIIADYIELKSQLVYNSVSEMKSAENLYNGSFAKTYGFYSYNDGGGSLYKVRTITNEDIVDEMTIIALNDQTLIAELIPSNKIYPEQLGAKGDNLTDDYASIQKAIDYANANNLVVEFYNKKTYLVSDTIKLYSEKVYNCNNCTIKQTSNKPTVASIKYFDSSQIGFNIIINDLNIEGDTSNTSNDGLILSGWFAKINNVNVRNVGGHGLVVTSYDVNGDEFTGTSMVEGMINNSKFYSYNENKYPLYQHCNNIHITDWRLENCIFTSTNCKNFMYFDRMAGWYLNNVQCYGKSTENAIVGKFATGTQIENLTLDGVMSGGLFLDSQIGPVNASNIHIIVHSTATENIYALRQTGGSSTPNSLCVSNINVTIPSETTPSNLYLHRGSAYILDVVNPIFVKNHVETSYKLYYYKGSDDVFRLNGFNVQTDTPSVEISSNLAKHYNLEQYSSSSATLTMTITPPAQIRNSGLLIITGEVNGDSKGSSVYSIGLMRRGTTQPCNLVSEQTDYEFTNVSVTYNSGTNTYTITATTPNTSNCQYAMSVIY